MSQLMILIFSKCAGIETHVAMLLFARYPFDHLCWLTINVNALLFFYACFFRMNNYLSLYFEVLHQHHVLDTGDWFRWARTHKSNIFKTVAYYTIQLQRNLIGKTCVTPWEDISIKKCTKSKVVLDHTVLYWA